MPRMNAITGRWGGGPAAEVTRVRPLTLPLSRTDEFGVLAVMDERVEAVVYQAAATPPVAGSVARFGMTLSRVEGGRLYRDSPEAPGIRAHERRPETIPSTR